ncbi:LOW QUALITY PROTEIN: hypothetical protein Cgig2_010971 [Carnegiea gigantea]|uniref:Uncharacterized protein n=1 Tax=Carnegiea gigantea TaxID=171969 RepID=A0A9Q1GP66_9CARY|nr:LOW QUALITY PROTEIN: hypothetical protein Cgig2_010971 [Carnegiea gigantea]
MENYKNTRPIFVAVAMERGEKARIQSQWRVGGFYGLQWNKDGNDFPGEYRRGKTIDRIDCQSIIHGGETDLGIDKHDTRNPRAHRTFGISPWLSTSPLEAMFRMWKQRFSIQQVISHIADGSTELQKTPNEVEVHGLTHDERFFNDHEFFDAHLKMEAVVLKHYQHRTPMSYTPPAFNLDIPLSPDFPNKGTHTISNSPAYNDEQVRLGESKGHHTSMHAISAIILRSTQKARRQSLTNSTKYTSKRETLRSYTSLKLRTKHTECG